MYLVPLLPADQLTGMADVSHRIIEHWLSAALITFIAELPCVEYFDEVHDYPFVLRYVREQCCLPRCAA